MRSYFPIAISALVVGVSAASFVACSSSEDNPPGGNQVILNPPKDAAPDKITPQQETGPDSQPDDANPDSKPIPTEGGDENITPEAGDDSTPGDDVVQPDSSNDVSTDTSPADTGTDVVVEDVKHEVGPEPDAGVPFAIWTTGDGPGALTLDADSVYVAVSELSAKTIVRITKNGSESSKIVTESGVGVSQFPSLAADDTHLYWVNNANSPQGYIHRVAKAGGQPQTVADKLDAPVAIALDSNYVYWAEKGTGASTGNIKRIKKDLSGAETLRPNVNYPLSIAVDETSVFWTQNVTGTGGAYRIGKDKSSYLQLGTEDKAYEISIWGDTAYWTAESGTVSSRPKNGTGSVTILYKANEPSVSDPRALATNQAGAYWVDYYRDSTHPSSINFIPNGGTYTQLLNSTISDGAFKPVDIVADDKAIYWTATPTNAANWRGVIKMNR